MNKRLESVLEFCNNNNYTIREYIDTGGVRVTHQWRVYCFIPIQG